MYCGSIKKISRNDKLSSNLEKVTDLCRDNLESNNIYIRTRSNDRRVLEGFCLGDRTWVLFLYQRCYNFVVLLGPKLGNQS